MNQTIKAVAFPAILLSSSISQVWATPIGVVGYVLELNQTARQTYAYVFSGTVTSHGKACAGAHVMIDISGAHDQAATETVDADENGRYLLKVALQAMPQEMTTWHLTAKARSIHASEPGEAEGRMILMDETTVVVERPLQISEGDL